MNIFSKKVFTLVAAYKSFIEIVNNVPQTKFLQRMFCLHGKKINSVYFETRNNFFLKMFSHEIF